MDTGYRSIKKKYDQEFKKKFVCNKKINKRHRINNKFIRFVNLIFNFLKESTKI